MNKEEFKEKMHRKQNKKMLKDIQRIMFYEFMDKNYQKFSFLIAKEHGE